MYKILELLINEFENVKPTAEYQIVQIKFCDAEKLFLASLGEEQRKAYFDLERNATEMHALERNAIATYIFENLKNFF